MFDSLYSPRVEPRLAPLQKTAVFKFKSEVCLHNSFHNTAISPSQPSIFDMTSTKSSRSFAHNRSITDRSGQFPKLSIQAPVLGVSSIPSFRTLSVHHTSDTKPSLGKVQLQDKQLMQVFKKNFKSQTKLQDAMNFNKDSDFFYQEEIKKKDTDEDILDRRVSPFGKSDEQVKLMVGNKSSMCFFKHHKQIDKIQQENDMFHIRDSFYTKMIKSQENFHLLPKKLGIIKPKGEEGILTLNHFSLGDKYAQVFSQGISSIDISSKIRKIELMDNGLTDKGIVLVLSSLSMTTEELNLSQNVLGSASVDKLVTILRNHEFQLKKLNLSNTKLNDRLGIRIVEALKKLVYLDLSNNRITDETSVSLANAISTRCTLNELYLNWNRMTGITGEKIAQAMRDNASIRVLDLSNNSLGLQNGVGCAEAFSKLFGQEESNVLHIDIGNNRWTKEHIGILMCGINANQSVYGLHIDSDYSSVDEFGFLNLIESEQNMISKFQTDLRGSEIISQPFSSRNDLIDPASMATPFTRIQGLLPIFQKQVTKGGSEVNNQAKNRTCWICNAWSEQLFIWKSGQSGMSYTGPIYVHMDFDGFKGIPMEKDESSNFFLRRMCPPSQRLLYFFSTPDGDTHAKDQPSIKSKNPYLKDIKFGSISRDIVMKFKNYRAVPRQEGGLFSNFFEPIHLSVLPREQLMYPVEQGVPKKQWQKEAAVFAKYQQDTQSILEKAMDADWNNSKIPRFVKDPVDRKKLFELIKPHYEGIKALYKYYSSFSPIGDIWAISKLLFTEIFTKSGLVDNKTLKLADLEIKFIASKTLSKKARGLIPERGMVRHEFLEGIVRIAEEKYMINGDCTSYAEAVQHLLTDGFSKVIAENESPAQWRDERYWNQECDFCYKYYMQILMAIFEQYENTIRTSLPKSKYLNLYEFRKIFTDTDILYDEHANERYVNLAFNYSVQTQADEVYDERILQLHFIEFLEALARSAEKFSPAPVLLTPSLDQEMSWEERNEQPLHKKIENLIRIIFYQALVAEQREQFELHELSIFDHNEIGQATSAPMRTKNQPKIISTNTAILLPTQLDTPQKPQNIQQVADLLKKNLASNNKIK